MEILKKEMQEKRKEFEKVLVFSILGIFLFYIILPYFLNYFFPFYKMVLNTKIFIFFFIGVAYSSYLISKTKYDFITLFRIMVITFFFLVFYLSIQLCQKSSAIYFFYIPLILMLLIVYNIRVTAICTYIVILMSIFTPYIARSLHIAKQTPSSIEVIKILRVLEVFIMFFSSYFSLIILYYYNEFNKIQLKHAHSLDEDFKEDFSLKNKLSEDESETDFSISNVESEKFETLYNQIIEFLENEKPYQNPNFKKRELAVKLKTNETYISKAINSKGNKTFNCLINEYRVNQVLKEFNTKSYKKVTIEYIYKQAGFTQQSTFNRIFKEYTKRTPSEYIEQMENTLNN